MFVEAITIFFLSTILLYIFRIYSKRFGMVDIPKSRSIHTKITPRGGGIIFIPIVLIDIAIFHTQLLLDSIPIFISFIIIWIVGIIDDIYEITPKVKFTAIAIAVIVVYYSGLGIFIVDNFARSVVTLGLFALPFTYFAVAGFTNAFNLIDGIDSLSTVVAISILSVFIYLSIEYNDSMLFTISFSLIVVLLSFLIFNYPPASIFMGDSGSLTLGFILSILFIKSINYIDAVSVLYIGALPITDTLVAMLRRKIDKRGLTQADKCHLHHIVLNITKSVPKSVAILISYQIFMIIIGLISSSNIDSAIMLIVYLLHIPIIYYLIRYLIKRYQIKCYPKI